MAVRVHLEYQNVAKLHQKLVTASIFTSELSMSNLLLMCGQLKHK